MNKDRMKVYDAPHKGLRNGLSRLSLLAGKTDFSDPEAVERLVKLAGEVFLLLDTHARDENAVSLRRLEEKRQGAALHDLEEHARIHAAQSRLENILDEIRADSKQGKDAAAAGAEFYSLFSDFHAGYLEHMSEEERVTQRLLWDGFTDEELAGHRAEIMQSLPPETLLLWFEYIAPAQSHRERVGLFQGFKAHAPAPLFNRAREVLVQSLSAGEYGALMKELE